MFTYIFMRRHKDEVDSKEFKEKYGGFMTNCETYKHREAVNFPAYSLFRRTVFAFTIGVINFSLVLQVMLATNTSLLFLCWLVQAMPFDMSYKNLMEISNEFLVLMFSYLGFLFSDFVPDPRVRSQL